MKEQHEKLSSLIDDYQADEPDQSLLNDVLGDVNQQYTMRRYQMIGEVMRNELPEAIKLDFAADVMAKIDHESTLQVKQPAKSTSKSQQQQEPSWLWSVLFKPMAGVAVAATVAFVAISGLQLQTADIEQNDRLANANSSSVKVEQLARIPVANIGVSKVSVNGQRSTSPVGMNWKIRRNEPAIQKKLNTYLINHNEYSNSMQGIIPQVRVVGFDAQK